MEKTVDEKTAEAPCVFVWMCMEKSVDEKSVEAPCVYVMIIEVGDGVCPYYNLKFTGYELRNRTTYCLSDVPDIYKQTSSILAFCLFSKSSRTVSAAFTMHRCIKRL